MFTREEINAPIIATVLTLANACKTFGNKPANFTYLLNQALRQYQLKEENIHMSKEFYALWTSVTNEEVYGVYDQKVECVYDNVNVKYFPNANKNYYEEIALNKGDKFKWNNIFHCEHTTTVSDISKKLLSEENLNEEKVYEILETIHICRLTKSEDKKINALGGVRNHRNGSYEYIVENIYNKAGIEIIK